MNGTWPIKRRTRINPCRVPSDRLGEETGFLVGRSSGRMILTTKTSPREASILKSGRRRDMVSKRWKPTFEVGPRYPPGTRCVHLRKILGQ